MNLHEVDVVHMLQMAGRLGYPIGPTVIYGVKPGEIGWSMELSPAVTANMSKLLELVVAEIESIAGTSP